MLQSLHVHNFALLEDAQVDFSEGFNVFTGETGAGKSILIDAFGIVLGARAATEDIRSGADSYWVQAVFEQPAAKTIELLAEQGLTAEDGQLFIRRQVNSNGKSRAYVNDVQVSIAFLKQLGASLVDIHGQHENQALLREQEPLLLTDSYGGKVIAELLTAYRQIYQDFQYAAKKLSNLRNLSGDQERLLDRCQWEIEEITDAKLKKGEEEALEKEAKLLQHSEKIISACDNAYNFLDDDNGVLNRLALAKNSLASAVRYDERLQQSCDNLESAWLILDDCRQELKEYLTASDFNSARSTAVQERLDLIYRLQKKYGGSTEAILNYLSKLQTKYTDLLNISENIAVLEKQVKALEKDLEAAAAKLSSARQQAALAFGKAVTEEIHDLALPHGEFQVDVQKDYKFTVDGKDVVDFLFSANLGEPLNIFSKVASGGELSRIALAIKTVLAVDSAAETMVFDEIDSGVGGVTARKMAEKIAVLSHSGQVLCVTHLPQIAAFADRHIYIAKKAIEGRTVTDLEILDDEGRIRELMRMTAGLNESAAARANAKEILASAADTKKSLMRKNKNGEGEISAEKIS